MNLHVEFRSVYPQAIEISKDILTRQRELSKSISQLAWNGTSEEISNIFRNIAIIAADKLKKIETHLDSPTNNQISIIPFARDYKAFIEGQDITLPYEPFVVKVTQKLNFSQKNEFLKTIEKLGLFKALCKTAAETFDNLGLVIYPLSKEQISKMRNLLQLQHAH
jgi:hypothetical protein